MTYPQRNAETGAKTATPARDDEVARLRAKLAQARAELARHEQERASQPSASPLQWPDDHALLIALIDSIPDPIFLKDCHGAYLHSNRAHLDRAGCTLEQLRGRTCDDI